MTKASHIRSIFEQTLGIFRMLPCWVPRTFNQPGQRLRLHPDDYYALGLARGAIKERWFSSVTSTAMNASVPWDEGLSYVAYGDTPEDKFLFREAVAELGAALIGPGFWEQYHNWPMYSKFFDYKLALFHHLHLDDEAARRVGRLGKPEAYYFPPQFNPYSGEFPVTYFGFDPGVTKEMVRQSLLDYEKKDNRLTGLSRAYRLTLGTGWYIPAGVVHAPGSLLTYEPQWNSDVAAVFENVVSGEVMPRSYLVNDVPEDQKANVDYLIELMDWDANVDPFFRQKYFRPPLPLPSSQAGLGETWITYASPFFSAKETTVAPGAQVTLKDGAAYGCILVQGHGRFGPHAAETAVMLRYGQLSADEYFVSEQSAQAGVTVTNHSRTEPMVILRHFRPNQPEAPQTVDA